MKFADLASAATLLYSQAGIPYTFQNGMAVFQPTDFSHLPAQPQVSAALRCVTWTSPYTSEPTVRVLKAFVFDEGAVGGKTFVRTREEPLKQNGEPRVPLFAVSFICSKWSPSSAQICMNCMFCARSFFSCHFSLLKFQLMQDCFSLLQVFTILSVFHFEYF